MREKELAAFLQQYKGRPLKLMEVCGTHTSALYRTGLRQLLPETITLVSGPGCPVCVTPTSYIDKLVEYAFTPGCQVMTFGDMLAVPGSKMSLAEARDQGGAADFFYSPEEMLEKAKAQPETTFVLAAVGFETAAPVWATVIKMAADNNLKNIKFLTALKTMPQALSFLCSKDRIDGFLCPGHVRLLPAASRLRIWPKPMGKLWLSAAFRSPSCCGRWSVWCWKAVKDTPACGMNIRLL